MESAREAHVRCESRWLWVFVLACLTSTVTGVVDVTIVSKYQFFDQSADTWLYCYYTGSLISQNGFQFGVEADTGSGTRFTIWRNSFAVPGDRRVRIGDSAGDFRVGAFSCQVSDGNQTEKAITFKMKSQADVWPVSFTVTANTGDPVTLQMVQKSSRTGTLVWRKGGVGGTVLTGQNGLNLTISSAQSSDEGIYECYYQGDTDRKQGIMRLIVRGCAKNKWGPSCTGDCPVCYNGGVCDDNTGECVCPPGFHGQNCESACFNDMIGTSCTRQCGLGDCTGQLLCVMDPYGCSCGPGLMGIECNTVCPDGLYGAGCTQTCHCADGPAACDVKTGVCSSGGCEAGWKGNNCQTACSPGEFGSNCTGTCHCAVGDSVCDIRTGVCSSGGCEAGWKGNNCQTVCSPGEFGPDCTDTCHCASGSSVCDIRTGVCNSGGCEAGWKGSECQTACTAGEFGADCTGTCHCASGGSVCDIRTGVCSSGGCEAGWKGNNCQTVCSPGEFGPGCTTTCHCASGDSVCTIRTGVCSSGGCEAGWKGGNCQTECPDGLYGAGCTQTCHCADGPAACDKKTGACTGVCVDFWTGDSCQIRTATVSYEGLFSKEEGRFFGDSPDHITTR